MLLSISYKNAQRLRTAAFVILSLTILLTGYKGMKSYEKIQLYTAAAGYLDEQDMITAEDYFQRTQQNHWLQYRDAETSQALFTLKPVTETRQRLIAIERDTKVAMKSHDTMALIVLYHDYQERKTAAQQAGGDQAAIFTALANTYHNEEAFQEALTAAKARIVSDVQADLRKKSFSDANVELFLQLPGEYFTDEAQRRTELQRLLEPYETGRIEALATQTGSFPAVLAEGLRLISLYKPYNNNAEWLSPIIERYAQNMLTAAVAKDDIPLFIQNSKHFDENAVFAQLFPNTRKLIENTFSKQLDRAKSLVTAGKYADALVLFSKLDTFRDTSQQAKDVELKWATAEPAHLLQNVYPGITFTSIVTGKNLLGALVYAIGVTDNKVVLARLLPDITTDRKEVVLGTLFAVKNIKVIENLSTQGIPTLVVEGNSSSRKARYAFYEFRNSQLNKYFDIEADSYQLEKTGTILVDNTIGMGTGQQSYFEFNNGIFSFSRLKQDFIPISLSELKNYRDVKVRFDGTIMSVLDNNIVILSDGTYLQVMPDSGSNVKLRVGSATIIGTWVGSEEIRRGSGSGGIQTIQAYKMTVFSAIQ